MMNGVNLWKKIKNIYKYNFYQLTYLNNIYKLAKIKQLNEPPIMIYTEVLKIIFKTSFKDIRHNQMTSGVTFALFDDFLICITQHTKWTIY